MKRNTIHGLRYISINQTTWNTMRRYLSKGQAGEPALRATSGTVGTGCTSSIVTRVLLSSWIRGTRLIFPIHLRWVTSGKEVFTPRLLDITSVVTHPLVVYPMATPNLVSRNVINNVFL